MGCMLRLCKLRAVYIYTSKCPGVDIYSPYSRVKREHLSVLEGLMVFVVTEYAILCARVCTYT